MKIVLMAIFCCCSFIVRAQIITTVVGGGSGGGTDGYGGGLSATSATLGNFAGIAFDTIGNLYIADKDRQIIRKVDAYTKIITTVVGNGTSGFNGDGGQATNAEIKNPGWMAFDFEGNLFFSDRGNHRIRKVDAFGIISTVVGNGTPAFLGDGLAATNASMSAPQGVCIDRNDNIYVSDNGNSRIRKTTSLGIIGTVAGIGTAGYSGDEGAATLAQINGCLGIRNDTSGNLYIAEWNGNRIRKVNIATGIISTFAGNGVSVYTGDGVPATTSPVNPFDVEIDDTGNIIIADFVNNRIRKVNNAGIITTIVGNGTTGFGGDGGHATAASLNRPAGVAFDPCGNLYIADNQNYRVRKVTFYSIGTPTIAITGVTTAAIGATVTVNATVSGAGSSYTIKWFKNAILFSTTTVPTATYTKGTGTDVITARVVPTMLTCYDSATSAGHTITQQTVGLSSVMLAEFQIYPNPVGNIIAISGTEAINNVLITDIMGRAVATLPKVFDKENELHLHLSHLPKGVYFIKVNDWYVQRFLKE